MWEALVRISGGRRVQKARLPLTFAGHGQTVAPCACWRMRTGCVPDDHAGFRCSPFPFT